MKSYNITQQMEEVESLAAIYGDEWKIESSSSYSISIRKNNSEAILHVTLPIEYPGQMPPRYELSSPMMGRKMKTKLQLTLDSIYAESGGEPILYQWVEKIRETLLLMQSESKKMTNKKMGYANNNKNVKEFKCPEVITGNVISDRKSHFQAHVAIVHSLDEVRAVVASLRENKKLSSAKHNVYAYRVEVKAAGGACATSTLLQDCDNDGEAHAGSNMLHLMQLLDVRNVVVVTTRWFGGIQIGSDRFRHYNNAVQQVLDQAGIVKKLKTSNKKK